MPDGTDAKSFDPDVLAKINSTPGGAALSNLQKSILMLNAKKNPIVMDEVEIVADKSSDQTIGALPRASEGNPDTVIGSGPKTVVAKTKKQESF